MTGPDELEPTTRAICQEVEVPGTPEEVWEAIATGPGISAWFVPTDVEPLVGGVIRQEFGEAEEMHVEGRVQAWEPPRRFAYGQAAHPGEGLAFEFLVEARDGGTCVVRLVNSGFGSGEEWDDQYDGMDGGWQIFLRNLQMHLELFPGRPVSSSLSMAAATGGRDATWARLAEAMGIDRTFEVGGRLTTGGSAPHLSGVIRSVAPQAVSLVLDEPAPGTGFLAVEGAGDAVGLSVWLYLRGDDAPAVAAREHAAWDAWLAAVFPPPAGGPEAP